MLITLDTTWVYGFGYDHTFQQQLLAKKQTVLGK